VHKNALVKNRKGEKIEIGVLRVPTYCAIRVVRNEAVVET